ncbi:MULTISPECIES: hypothetical protein [unclassified Bacillus (in: firmicutes)]|uniref:hypothetical protein n=1 Tax=unclassified Bacillus (in: firmicutes) TaxID=185979 RepID=UPI000BF1A807|nr:MULTISPECIES: hypothetical protein [unclassified Bacillus (in: firmicutes)]PEJ57136.1 hypothetical protein CN692_14710 [Bacillus sp. AFS002410]PEL14054.1 hypothetical protein CN601_02115 [Bacillus sp. AFS017336]
MKKIIKYVVLSPIIFYLLLILLVKCGFDEYNAFGFTLSIFLGAIIGLLVMIYKRLSKDTLETDKVKAAYDHYRKEKGVKNQLEEI